MKSRCVATSADCKYFPALMVLLRSLRRTNPHLPVIVFDGGLTSRQAGRAKKFAQVLPKDPPFRLEGRGKFSYIGDTTLLKFEVSGLDCEKVLYLDVDMVVMEDLEPLFDFPEGTVGVVREYNSAKNMFRVQHREMLVKSMNIDLDSPGFNAGLFALRPREWRDLPEKARNLINRFGEDVFSKSKDQQLLNIIFRGKTYSFPGRYNFSPFYDDEKVKKPAIIHYLSQCKPWHSDYPPGHRYDEFRSSLSVFDFPGIILADIRRKLKNLLLKT